MKWSVKHQYALTFLTRDKWVRFVEFMAGRAELDPDDLDAVYQFFEAQNGMIRDWMEENSGDQYWIGTVDAEIDDLDFV